MAREGGAAGGRECGERVREREKGDEGVRRDTGRYGGAYSLGNRKEGAGGWRGCGEARVGNAGKGQGLRRLSVRRGK